MTHVLPEGMRFSWTQPICERCWINSEGTWEPHPEGGPGAERLVDIRRPVTLTADVIEVERCAWCGHPTIFGAYKRANPQDVPYPRPEKEEE